MKKEQSTAIKSWVKGPRNATERSGLSQGQGKKEGLSLFSSNGLVMWRGKKGITGSKDSSKFIERSLSLFDAYLCLFYCLKNLGMVCSVRKPALSSWLVGQVQLSGRVSVAIVVCTKYYAQCIDKKISFRQRRMPTECMQYTSYRSEIHGIPICGAGPDRL